MRSTLEISQESLQGKSKAIQEKSELSFKPSPEDVDLKLATRAYEGTSFSPEKRGKAVQTDYVRYMEGVYNDLLKYADTPEKVDLLNTEMARFKEGYLKRLNSALGADSRTMSSMITGPANFPTKSNLNKMDVAQNRWKELDTFSDKVVSSIKRKLTPEKQPIRSDDPQAIQRLEAKIIQAEKNQEAMKTVNKIVRDKKISNDKKLKQLSALENISEKSAKELLKPDYTGRTGFPKYSLTNNNANIRRMKQRVEKLRKESQTETVERPFDGGIILENAEQKRIQLIFDEKPSAEMRAELKSNGFRWSPKNTAWQRMLNDAGRSAVRKVVTEKTIKPEIKSEPLTPIEQKKAFQDVFDDVINQTEEQIKSGVYEGEVSIKPGKYFEVKEDKIVITLPGVDGYFEIKTPKSPREMKDFVKARKAIAGKFSKKEAPQLVRGGETRTKPVDRSPAYQLKVLSAINDIKNGKDVKNARKTLESFGFDPNAGIELGFLGMTPQNFKLLKETLSKLNFKYKPGKLTSQEIDALYTGKPLKLTDRPKTTLGAKLTPDFLKQAQNRGKTQPFKEVVSKLDMGDRKKHRRAGDVLEKFRQLGLNKLNEKGAKGLADALEAGEAPKYRKVLDEMFFRARSIGIEIPGYTKNYFPRMLNEKVGNILFEDLNGLNREIAKLKESREISDVVLKRLIEKKIENKHLRPETIEMVEHLVESGQAKTQIDAFNKLYSYSFSDVFSPFGNLESSRTLELPIKYYERDARKVLSRYTAGWAKRTAEAEQFGVDGSIAVELRKKIDNLDPKEADIAWQMIQSWTGAINKDPSKILSKKITKAVDFAVQFEVATKIGLGTATIPNITQTFISTLPQAGLLRTLKGAYRLLRPTKKGAAERSKIRGSGAILDTTMRTWAGLETKGAMGKFTEKLLGLHFTPINKFNNYLAASTAEVYIKDLHRLSRKTGLRQKWAENKLKEYGLDKNKLTNNDIAEFMYRFSTDAQLLKNVLRDPLSSHDPRFRALWLFKKFGVKQAQLIKDKVLVEGYKNKNIMPVLRLAAGGYLGGEFVSWARNKIKEGVSGEKFTREDEDMLERVAENYAAVGSFGVMSDLVTSGLFSPFPFEKSVKFTIIPVQFQTATKVWDTLWKFGTEIENYGLGGASERSISRGMKILGPLMTQFAKRFETSRQKKGRIDFIRGRVKHEIFTELIDGNSEKAALVFNAWNNKYPERSYEPKEFNDKAILKRIEFESEKRLQP